MSTQGSEPPRPDHEELEGTQQDDEMKGVDTELDKEGDIFDSSREPEGPSAGERLGQGNNDFGSDQRSAASKDQVLQRFLDKMDRYAPIIPDVVLDHYLSISGFSCSDVRVKRLLGLAAQKFLSDIAQDAYQYSRIRVGTSGSGGAAAGGSSNVSGAAGAAGKYRSDRNRTVLTMEDLSTALAEYGVNMRRPDFYH